MGKHRIGKSSLLYHFCQTYEQRLQASGPNPQQQYVAIYLSLQEASCHTQSDFYQAVAREFLKRLSVKTNSSLTDPLSQSSFNNKSFAEAMLAWKDAHVLPILCLDKIEAMFDYPQEFNNGFFDNLRSLLDSNALMVIIASYKNLDKYSLQHRLTSSFFQCRSCFTLSPLFSALWVVVSGVVSSVISLIPGSVGWSVASAIVASVAVGVLTATTWPIAWSMALSVIWGVALGVAFVEKGRVTWGVASSLIVGLILCVILGIGLGGALGGAFILGVLRVSFWIPELLWSLALFLFSLSGAVSKTLPYLPPRFDELIYLPLPFLDTLIIESYPDNPAAARQTINYLITSTNQQRIAAQAILGIALTTLDCCQTMTDIVAISDELNSIPSPPPKQLGEILPNFLEISQTVRATQSATTAYRQIELLQKPIAALGEIQNRLAFNRNPFLATSFGSITQRWLQILQTACRTLTETAEKSGEIPQPYIAGSALDPDDAKSRFKGRQDLFRQIENLSLSPNRRFYSSTEDDARAKPPP